MKVLFATSFKYLPQRSGGSESSTHDLCMALMEKGADVGVICSLGTYDPLWLINRVKSKLSGKRFIRDRRLPYPVFRGYDVKPGIREVVEVFKPDVAVVQAGYPFELVNEFSRINVPVVLYARDVKFSENREALEKNRFVAFIANSQFTANSLKALLSVEALVLPPLVAPDQYRVNSIRRSVLQIGLSPEKGIETSFALAARRPDIPFHFVESWPVSQAEFKTYKERAQALGNVRIHRRSANMKPFYSDARLLLVPSVLDEAWGRVVTEAQLSGIPAIVSNRGGLPESLGNGGTIVPAEADIDLWEAALSRVWDDTELYSGLAAAALERSQQADVSREKITEKFVSFLHEHILSVR